MDVYVIYPVLCVDIYVISLFVLMESKKTKKITFFPSLSSATLGKAAKQRPNFLALPSAEAMALGKDFFKKIFAECQGHGTRQRFFKKIKKSQQTLL
jgi:hypothetical protein